MNNKGLYLVMRGIGRFLSDFKPNIVSLITLCTLIFVYHILYAAGGGASAFLKHVAEVKSVRAYLQTDARPQQENIVLKIYSITGVSSAIYFSPADAKKYVEENAPNINGLKSFSEEFFPAFIEITPKNPNDQKSVDNIADAASKIVGVESVSYGKEVMAKFLNVSRGATVFMLILSALFAVSVAFVVYNTVKLSLYKFRDEIKLYALVGATRSFITVPFAVSALLIGLTAFCVGSVFFYFGLTFFNDQILFPAGINTLNLPDWKYFAYFFAFVCLVSFLASLSSVKSFLRRVSSINED